MSLRPVKPKACIPCRTRKVKCDRRSPCSNCTAWSLECISPSHIRKCSRPRKNSTAASHERHDSTATTESLNDRILKLENTVQTLADFIKCGRPGSLAGSKFIQQNEASIEEDRLLQPIERRPDTLVTRSPSTWSSVAASPALSTIYDSTIEPSYGTYHTLNTFPFSRESSPFNSLSIDTSFLHLSPAQIDFCWQKFLENADQIVKVLHTPTAERILRKAKNRVAVLDSGQEALVFAIYFSSILSMEPRDVESCFGTTKDTLLMAYRSGIERVLSKAGFLTTTDLNTLQAFILLLCFSIFTEETKFVWPLTGLARRLICSIRESKSPLVVEIYKRLWWQLWYLDGRTAEDHGQPRGPYEAIAPPALPLNINDSDIDATMTEAPSQRNGWSEISFCLIRLEIARTNRRMDGVTSQTQKKYMIKDCWSRIKSDYLAHCNDKDPLQWLANHVAHVLNTEMWLKFYGQERPSPSYSLQEQSHRDSLFLLCVDIVDSRRRVEREAHAKRWKWLLKGYLQSLPLGFLLTELCYRESSDVVDHAWEVAQSAFAKWRDNERDSKTGVGLHQLMEKAKEKRRQLVERQPFELSPELQTQPKSQSDMPTEAGQNRSNDSYQQRINFSPYSISDYRYDLSAQSYLTPDGMTPPSRIAYTTDASPYFYHDLERDGPLSHFDVSNPPTEEVLLDNVTSL
ncbi:hypothetical protein FQN50_008874 [Emmonsiellopsis sp. PD_5]|nr:hypothetical protein FQN50_008874 [Emmonsiellopsis sp. PD_5]